MEWPQVQKQWTPDELNYISNINPKADVELLSKHFKFRDVSFFMFFLLYNFSLDLSEEFQDCRNSLKERCISWIITL